MNFIKNALRELKHVVWPTREETKKYFVVVLAVLIAFGLFLFVFGSLFGNTLRWLKSMVNPVDSSTQNIEIPANTIEGNTLNGTEWEAPIEIEWITVEWTSVDTETWVSSEVQLEATEVEPVIETVEAQVVETEIAETEAVVDTTVE